MGIRATVGMPTPLLFTLSGVWLVSLASLITLGFRPPFTGPLLIVMGLSSVAMLVVVPAAGYALITNKALRTAAQCVGFWLCTLCLMLLLATFVAGHLAWGS
jgi:hypothetical protein